MEKKTIGKFISALRRANGMTQKELAEKLFVSDKTVSRWECDECTPDLTLIPVIAELFGVTSDELLRGERKTGEENANDGGRYALKSEKQVKTMLASRLKTYNNLTMISFGIALVGWLLGVLCNFAFYNGVLGFVLATIFFLGSEICQICFARSLRMPLEDVEEGYQVRVQSTNACMAKSLVWISVLNLGLFAFTLPMAFAGGDAGLAFAPWLGFGLLFAVVGLLLTYILYTLWIKPLLLKKNILEENAAVDERHKRNVVRMGKIGAVVGIVALLIGVAILIVNMLGWRAFANYETYTDAQAFKERMESDYDRWYNDGAPGVMPGVIVTPDPEKPSGDYYEQLKNRHYIYDENGVKVEYYFREELYRSVEYVNGGQSVPVRVLTENRYFEAWNTFHSVQSFIGWLLPADILGGVAVYLILWGKDRNK